MSMSYNEEMKDLPVNQLCKLFALVGWANGEHEETEERLRGFM